MSPNEAYPKAREAVGKALALDARLAEAHTSSGLIKFQYDWDWKGAEQEFRQAIGINPNYAPAHHFFADYLKAMGRFDEALAEIEKAYELDPLSLAMLGHGLASAGRRDEAMQILEKLRERSKSQYVPSYWIAVIYNGLRDRGQVIAWMRKAFDERSSWLVWANVEPRFAWLKDDPDFTSLMNAMQLP